MSDSIALPVTTYGPRVFKIKQGDTHDPILFVARDQRQRVLSIAGATSVSLKFSLADGSGTLQTRAASYQDPNAGQMKYQWVAGDTAIAGDYNAAWTVVYADGTVQTFPTDSTFQKFTIEPALV